MKRCRSPGYRKSSAPSIVSASSRATSTSPRLVVLHRVDLERDSFGPGAAELRERDGRVQEQGALGARTRLGEKLRRHRSEREPGVDDLGRQILRGEPASLHDRVEAGLPDVGHAVGELGERPALVEIRRVHDVSLRREARPRGRGTRASGPARGGRAPARPCSAENGESGGEPVQRAGAERLLVDLDLGVAGCRGQLPPRGRARRERVAGRRRRSPLGRGCRSGGRGRPGSRGP